MLIWQSSLHFFKQKNICFNISLLKLERSLDYLPMTSDTDYQATSQTLQYV